MHILTFLALTTLPIALLVCLYFWLTEGGGNTEKLKADFNKARAAAKSLIPHPPEQKKIIRVRPEDALEQFFCAVVGESFDNDDGTSRQDIIKKHGKPGIQVHLEREPDNPHDGAAIAVYLADQQIGYLKGEVAARHAPKIDTGRYALYAEISSVNGGTKKKPNIGVTLEATLFKVRKQ